MKNANGIFNVLLIAGAVIFTAACTTQNANRINVESPSQLMKQKPELSSSDYQYSWNIGEEGTQPVGEIARGFLKNGQSNLSLTVTYGYSRNAAVRKNLEDKAMKSAVALGKAFDSNGVRNIDVRIAPVAPEKAGIAVVSYSALAVKMPDECDGLSLDDISGNIELGDSYKFGCTRAALIAQSVADKKDLAGNGKMSPTGSARLGKTMSDYNSDAAPPAPQMNISISDVGGSE